MIVEEREQELVDTVLASFADTPDDRLRTIVTALTRHLHEFASEVRLTEAEWRAGIEFLTAIGHITDDKRQEFILLSDVLGLSMQIVTINAPTDERVTESTVLGPFFVDDPPLIENGGDIALGATGEPCWIEGCVRDEHGSPVAGARLDVWESDDAGRYDVQYTDRSLAARAQLFADDTGEYRFWALTPTPYPIPDDGPVGRLISATARSPMRAPHLHVMVTAPGFHTLITHIFVAGADAAYDTVFGVRDSLIRQFDRHEAAERPPDGRTVDGTWTSTRFDIVLARDPSMSDRD
jgi:hydroxyquinol 1,2-dioxygenase